MTLKNQLLSQTVQNSHATIVEIPRGYGFDFAKKQIEFEGSAEILDFLPRIHEGQKTEIINADDIEEVRTKMRGKSKKPQILLFWGAEKMNEAAQNKFLKLLEEPRDNLRFILLAESLNNILETVKSRCQQARILPISREESEAILKNLKISDEAKLRQILFLVEGLPEKLQELAKNKRLFENALKDMEEAKKWLAGNGFERISIASSIKTDREKALNLLENLLKIIRATMNEQNAKQNAEKMRAILAAHNKISQNRNIRLCFLELILAF